MFILLVHWHNIPRIDMLLHSNTLSWFRANQSLLFLLNAACLINTNFIVFGLTRTELEPSIYHTRGKHAYHYNITNANNDVRNTTQKHKDRATWSPLNFELFLILIKCLSVMYALFLWSYCRLLSVSTYGLWYWKWRVNVMSSTENVTDKNDNNSFEGLDIYYH